MSSRRYAKSYLKGVTERLQTLRIRLPGRAVQYRTSTEQGMPEEDRY
jgi:hypothetical protein